MPDIFYGKKVRDLNHLQDRIDEALTTATEDMLTNVWRELEYLLNTCRATIGTHTDIYSIRYVTNCLR